MRRRILILSQHYRPEPNFIVTDVAEALTQHAEVTVITAHPNYPFGRFYPGTRFWWPARNVENGVTVWRVPFFPDHSTSKVRRMVSYLSFAVAAGLLAPFVASGASLVWVYHGPFTTALAALWHRLVRRSRVILTCADLWPESFVAAGVARPGRLMELAFRYRRTTNRLAEAIICSTRGTLECFAAEGVPRASLHHVPVWVDGTEGDCEPAESETDEAVIVYAGNLGPAQQLSTVVRAAAEMQQEAVRVRFDLYGAGADEPNLRTLVSELGITNVRFRGRVTPEEAFRASRDADAQLVILRRDPLFRMTIPSKVSACFAAGTPILYGLEGEAAELVAGSGAGIAFDPDDPASFAAAVRDLLSRGSRERAAMGTRLREYYRRHFERRWLLERYIGILLDLPMEATHKELIGA